MRKVLIIVFLLLTFQFIFPQEINGEKEQTAWKFIHYNFIVPYRAGNYTDTYPRDIAVKLEGNVSREDSAYINELIS
jgi:tripartite-type tricarboxylate transporter receptor subunit TctC